MLSQMPQRVFKETFKCVSRLAQQIIETDAVSDLPKPLDPALMRQYEVSSG